LAIWRGDEAFDSNINTCFLYSSTTSCQTTNSKGKIIFEKNTRYDEKLMILKKTHLYNEVMPAFRDSFPILKTKKEYFGVPEVVTNQIDDAAFFKKDSSECMLLVLQRSGHPELIFATARTVRGFVKDNKAKTTFTKWKLTPQT